MSDFDREAERERLREQYEHDQKKREATEQMSDLLLKGATMTNSHCGECGDPIFRYDGQEFCPTCETVVGSDAASENGDGATTVDDETAATVETGDAAATADAGNGGGTEPESDDVGTPSTTSAPTEETSGMSTPNVSGGETAEEATEEAAASSRATAEQSPEADRQRVPSVSTESQTAPPATTQGDASLAAARASLVETITRFARQAEASDDPDACRRYLAATEDAADALAAVKRADE